MRLIPEEGNFFEYFVLLAEKLEQGGILFEENLDHLDTLGSRLPRLKEVEHQADEITHKIYRTLHQTFITPLDREDIRLLANTMDTVLDIIEAATARMYSYQVKALAPEIKELALILNKSISEIKHLACSLGKTRKNAGEITATCISINTLENEADIVLRRAMARLFEEEKDALELLKWKEILEFIETATDVCEDVSNVVEGIILKHG